MSKRMTAAQAKKLVQKSNQKTKAVLSQLGSIGGKPRPREFEFNPNSKHRADFYLPEYNLLIEIEGGTRGKSRHTTHDGYSKDLMKYNMAQILGYRRLAYTTEQVKNGTAIQNIKLFIKHRGKTADLAPQAPAPNTTIKGLLTHE